MLFPALPAPATPELFAAGEEDLVSCLLLALRSERAPGKGNLELPTAGAVRRGRDGPGCTCTVGKVLYLRVHALLILCPFKTTIIPGKIESGKQTNKQKVLIEGREKQDFSDQTPSLVIVPGELGQPVGFAAANVSVSLPCIALAGRSIISGSCQRAALGPDR